jgi:hypothetical protein
VTQIVLHIGLPKTGTTAFQSVCSQHAQELRANGVYYPRDQRWTLGTHQHQGLVAAFRRADSSQIEELVAHLRVAAENAPIVLVSSESFATFFGDWRTRDKAVRVHSALVEHFSHVRYVCVIRDEAELLRSQFRERVEAVGIQYDGSTLLAKLVNGLYERAEGIREVLSAYLVVPRYAVLGEAGLVPGLFMAATGIPLALPNPTAHETAGKPPALLLMGTVRMLLFNALKEPTPYTQRVNREYSQLARGISVSEDAARRIDELFTDWVTAELSSRWPDIEGRLERVFQGFPSCSSSRISV